METYSNLASSTEMFALRRRPDVLRTVYPQGAALEAALEVAIQSLTTCQAQQSQLLQHEVQCLKAEFRQRLAELEADFVARCNAARQQLVQFK